MFSVFNNCLYVYTSKLNNILFGINSLVWILISDCLTESVLLMQNFVDKKGMSRDRNDNNLKGEKSFIFRN